MEKAISQAGVADFNADGTDDIAIRTADGVVGAALIAGADVAVWVMYGALGAEWCVKGRGFCRMNRRITKMPESAEKQGRIPLSPELSLLSAFLFGKGGFAEGLARCLRNPAGNRGWLPLWGHYYGHDMLPEPQRSAWRKLWNNASARNWFRQERLEKLFAMLEANRIRFAPVKGAYLAYQVYPASALRPYGDWDVFFHPEDWERALAALELDGWTQPYVYSNPRSHHALPRVKEGEVLEPHWTLPGFMAVSQAELWKEIRFVSGNPFRGTLSPELNMLLIWRHAASQSYRHCAREKLLFDAAVSMLYTDIGWSRLRDLAERWRLPYPGHFIAAFPDFFPEKMLAKAGGDADMGSGWRRILDGAESLRSISGAEWVMCQADRGTPAWFLDRLRGCRPVGIRVKYRLPARGCYGTLLRAYAADLWKKLCGFCRYGLRRNPAVSAFEKEIAELEKRSRGKSAAAWTEMRP